MIFRANSISREILKEIQLKSADILIRPEANDIYWTDFGKIKECINRGREGVLKNINEIKSRIKNKQARPFFKRVSGLFTH